MRLRAMRRRLSILSALSLLVVLLVGVASGSASASSGSTATAAQANKVTTSSLGSYPPTFAGPAATGCVASGCDLLSGPITTRSTASLPAGSTVTPRVGLPDSARAVPALSPRRAAHGGSKIIIPTVSCLPAGPGCDSIDTSSGGAKGVKGLNAVDSATQPTNVKQQDIEPADQGLCAGNGYVVESNNIGEILIFKPNLKRASHVIPLDTVMGLTKKGWSSGGDISCLYDYANGGHWFFTEIVSASPESSGGPFAGCFAAVASTCYEGIAVTVGSNPFGPYHVYFMNGNYNPTEPGSPYLLNDFAKISTTRDAFLVFYDEFPLNGSVPGFGGGFFNGAQELAFNKTALELGMPTTLKNGQPNPAVTVASENMGLLQTPDGSCFSDAKYHAPGITCWYSVIPANPADQNQYDNSHGGSGFMLGTLDYYGTSDNRLAVWDWTNLGTLNSSGCSACSAIRFGGQLFSGVLRYYGEGVPAPQKAGPIPLGNECGSAGLSSEASCPEGGIATNGDNITQASQGQRQLWAAASTEVGQIFSNESPSAELHQAAVYWVVGTKSFDKTGTFTLTSQSYVAPAHEDVSMPDVVAEGAALNGGNGKAIIALTLSGNGGPTGADSGGFYPSTAYGRLTSTSAGLLGSVINIADLGQSPQDGFSEYQGYPGATRPRWGDYSSAIFLPYSNGKIYFSTQYIQYPNCAPPQFTLTVATCGGTRDGFANWGTSVNYVVP